MGRQEHSSLRVAVIGAGGRGRLSKLAHQPEAGSQLVAICDPLQDVRDDYAREFPGVAAYSDYREMLDAGSYDAIFVSTPDYMHEEHGIAALRSGAAVYLEKPLAITLEACDRILETAAAHGDRLYVGHNMRFFSVIQKMKALIDAGRIGRVQAIWCRHFINYGGDAYYKDWHSERRYSTGMLLQKGAHDIDVIHYLAGSHTQRVVGMGKLSVYNEVTNRRKPGEQVSTKFETNHWPPAAQTGLSPIIDIEDHSMMLMQLANGVQASYTQCHYTPDGWRNYTVIGDAGRIENEGDHTTDEYEGANASVRVYDQRHPAMGEPDEIIPIPLSPGSHGGADPQIVDDFLHFARTGERRGAHPIEARNAVAAGYLATRSLREGNQPFDIPAPPVTRTSDATDADRAVSSAG